jgi:hypothetical protein
MSRMGAKLEPWVFVAPYLAILIGLYLLASAWIAVIIYHTLMLLLLRNSESLRCAPSSGWRTDTGIPLVLASATGGISLYLLWPYLGLDGGNLRGTLSALGLQGAGLWIFCVYFSTVGAVLEELFWRFPVASDSRRLHWRDAFFAGYHALVLVRFVKPLWVIAIVFILFIVAWSWRIISNRTGGLAIPLASHIAADGSVAAALFLLLRS